MSITAISGLVKQSYTPHSQREQEQPATFDLMPLNGLEYMEIMTELKQEDGSYKISAKGLKAALNYGVVGWSNVQNSSGELMPYAKQNIKFIPAATLSDLANTIINISELGETERKNS